jgi:hypothetical protein
MGNAGGKTPLWHFIVACPVATGDRRGLAERHVTMRSMRSMRGVLVCVMRISACQLRRFTVTPSLSSRRWLVWVPPPIRLNRPPDRRTGDRHNTVLGTFGLRLANDAKLLTFKQPMPSSPFTGLSIGRTIC